MQTPRHLLRTSDLQVKEIESILDKAQSYKDTKHCDSLANKTIITIFFENSTRTLSSFEIAAKRLNANVIRLDVSKSSTSKGETISDTAANLNAMDPHAIIIRHKNAGAGYYLRSQVSCPIINGGDGAHAHPTQALLDLLTLKEYFGNDFSQLKGKKIAIVGDIKNSRVANSNIELLTRFGMEVLLVAPPHFLPPTNLPTFHRLRDIAQEVDAFMSLRTQTERHDKQIYGSLKDYASQYCITKEILGNRDVVILHPGPVHRNIDIDDEVLKDKRCKVLEQVNNGVRVRMAVLEYFINALDIS
ncbi:aspartate carbamoyltransferase catalytic subunit [Helicobacter sp. MIT 05-5293]|uniref:aspartate carbamoyltransferase catalytic subunit n=1 Tax=Helicobacter sp. MIT 05-5293 TaxID=1548149 RepID=UPI00051D5253|nr:aspartate carbamoyltransferase catalytic subunit [Helicobacter sp. MIT 05-5293]TLD80095.1 aspartate carbamoyltransferase catalytic subunit [Helicobacter sp. MIT 05-5293]